MSLFQKSILNSIKQDESLIATRWATLQYCQFKFSTKPAVSEIFIFEGLQNTLAKLKVDMKDFSIFRSIKQLYDEMMALQNEIYRMDGEIDISIGELYGQ